MGEFSDSHFISEIIIQILEEFSFRPGLSNKKLYNKRKKKKYGRTEERKCQAATLDLALPF